MPALHRALDCGGFHLYEHTVSHPLHFLPNTLTIARVVLIPVFVWLLAQKTESANLWGAIVFAVASITDWFDGFLARRWKVTSQLGAIMDPLADKLIVLAAAVMLVWAHMMPYWFAIALLSREFVVNGFRMAALSQGFHLNVISIGKAKTALQLVGIILLILSGQIFLQDMAALEIAWLLLYLSLALSWVSAGLYIKSFFQNISNT